MSTKIELINGNYQITIPIKEAYEDQNLRRFLDFKRIEDIASKSKAINKDIEKLSKDVKKDWWKKNKKWILNGTGN